MAAMLITSTGRTLILRTAQWKQQAVLQELVMDSPPTSLEQQQSTFMEPGIGHLME